MSEQTNRSPAKQARRSYRMSRRQAAIDRTRDRIVAAAFDLHATIGPSRTTIRAIADRASLQRHTVYAHFPDLDSLYEACTVHGIHSTGMPTPEGWRAISSPLDRMRHGLTEMVAWYRANAQMLGNVLFDIDPSAPPPADPDPFEVRMEALLDVLMEGWQVGPDGQPILRAIVSHALSFTTWRSLVAGGLADDQVVSVLVGLVKGVVDGSIPADHQATAPPTG